MSNIAIGPRDTTALSPKQPSLLDELESRIANSTGIAEEVFSRAANFNLRMIGQSPTEPQATGRGEGPSPPISRGASLINQLERLHSLIVQARSELVRTEAHIG